MEHITVGRKKNASKVAFVECVKNGSLNINMTFPLLRSKNYGDIATTHDMFMLKPFTNKAYVIPIADTQVEKMEHSANCMIEELEEQRDWYWSCRGRSYFTAII